MRDSGTISASTTTITSSANVHPKAALTDIPEQHTMEHGSAGRSDKPENQKSKKKACAHQENKDDVSVIYKNDDFKCDPSFVGTSFEKELRSYSYTNYDDDHSREESELRILYFTRPRRASFRDTPLFKLWRWMRAAVCIRKQRASSDSCC
ncbi:unnamed protein product [Phyllotreta striolata]|uniref:Uncharacterized protein n=1 Tax=Phyllotreta striolata TaxID=444603 RepID=A0A9N9TFQ4_PHYSR|nr:unnamed protein product [Phyllotreta striolata]